MRASRDQAGHGEHRRPGLLSDPEHVDPAEPARGEPLWYLDNVELRTVGIDIGSSTTHVLFSRVHLRRQLRRLSSRFEVIAREVLWRSPILFTPYRSDRLIDIAELDVRLRGWYAAAGFTRDDVDTGAVLLTGEALKRANSRAIADLFAAEGGRFVCATAGHNLEATLAAHGSGAVALSRARSGRVLNVDIGGGTTKLALVERGRIVGTSAVAVGGRLLAHEAGRIMRIDGPLRDIARSAGVSLSLHKTISAREIDALGRAAARVCAEYMLGDVRSDLARSLALTPLLPFTLREDDVVTISGGVAEYVAGREARDFGDLAPALAVAVLDLVRAGTRSEVRAADEGIRATVIGAAQFTAQLSGNTVYVSSRARLPLHNVPVLRPAIDPERGAADVGAAIVAALRQHDIDASAALAIAIDWTWSPRYELLLALANGIVAALGDRSGPPVVLAFSRDVASLVGRMLAEDLAWPRPLVSLDDVELGELDYIDVGVRLEPSRAVPLVIKSLLFPR